MSALAAQNLPLGVSEPLSLQKCHFHPSMRFFSAFEDTLVKACLPANFENVKCFVFSLLQTQAESPTYCRSFRLGLKLEARETYTDVCKREASSAFENVMLNLLVKAGLSDATRGNILNTLMELVCLELPRKFNDVLYGKLFKTLVEAEISIAHIIKVLSSRYLHYEDVRYFTAKNVNKLAMQHLNENITAYELNILEEQTKSQVPLYLKQNVKCDDDDANSRLIRSLRTRQFSITSSLEEEEGRSSETDPSKARIEVMPLDTMNKMERGTSDSNWLLSAARGKDEENHVSTNDKTFVGGGKDKRKNEEDNDDDEDDDGAEGGDSDDNDGSDDGEGEEEGNEDDDDDEGDDDDEEDDDEYDEEVAAQLAQQSKGVPVNDEDDDEDEESGDGEAEEGVDEEGDEEGVDEEGFEEENEDEDEDDDEDEDEEEEEVQPPKKKLKGA